MKSKYIVGYVRTADGPNLAAIVFPEVVVHATMAKRMFYNAESAGFVELYLDNINGSIGVHCYGKSESLGLDSEPSRDEDFVRVALGLSY